MKMISLLLACVLFLPIVFAELNISYSDSNLPKVVIGTQSAYSIPGVCGEGYVTQNTTSGGVECILVSSLVNDSNETVRMDAVYANISDYLTDISAISQCADDEFLDGNGDCVAQSSITTSPGGSDTQLQYNDGGSFGGANITYYYNGMTGLKYTNTNSSAYNEKHNALNEYKIINEVAKAGGIGNAAQVTNAVATTASTSDFNFGTNPFSICLWFNLTSQADVAYFASKQTYYNNGFAFYHHPTQNPRIQFYAPGFVRVANSNSGVTFNNNQWYFVCVTRNSSNTMNMYINGATHTGTTSAQNYDISATFRLFRDYAATRSFNGVMDEVAIFNRAVSLSEHQAWYNSGAGSAISDSETGLLALWHFDESSGSTAADSSGNSKTATFNTGPTWAAGNLPTGELIINHTIVSSYNNADGLNGTVIFSDSDINTIIQGENITLSPDNNIVIGEPALYDPNYKLMIYEETSPAGLITINTGTGQWWRLSAGASGAGFVVNNSAVFIISQVDNPDTAANTGFMRDQDGRIVVYEDNVADYLTNNRERDFTQTIYYLNSTTGGQLIQQMTGSTASPLRIENGSQNLIMEYDAADQFFNFTKSIGVGNHDGTSLTNYQIQAMKDYDGVTGMRSYNKGTGATSISGYLTETDASTGYFINHGSGRTITRYGVPLKERLEITDSNSNSDGLLIGAFGNSSANIVFGIGSTEQMRIKNNELLIPALPSNTNTTSAVPVYVQSADGELVVLSSSEKYKTDIQNITHASCYEELNNKWTEYIRISSGETETGLIAEWLDAELSEECKARYVGYKREENKTCTTQPAVYTNMQVCDHQFICTDEVDTEYICNDWDINTSTGQWECLSYTEVNNTYEVCDQTYIEVNCRNISDIIEPETISCQTHYYINYSQPETVLYHNIERDAAVELSNYLEHIKVDGNLTDIDTALMVEEIYTQSKVPQPNVNYMAKFAIDKVSVKNKHPAYTIIGTNELLNMEERIVNLEGAVAQLSVELCAESNNKYIWCEKK